MWYQIQTILDEKKMTLRELSQLAGYKNYSTLYMIKQGKVADPSFSTMMRIADALNVSLDDLRPDKGDADA